MAPPTSGADAFDLWAGVIWLLVLAALIAWWYVGATDWRITAPPTPDPYSAPTIATPVIVATPFAPVRHLVETRVGCWQGMMFVSGFACYPYPEVQGAQ